MERPNLLIQHSMGFTNNVEENWLMSNNEKFLFSETFSDVTFDFGEGNLIYAHSLPLAFASEVFAAQLFGRMQQRNIDIKDATLEDFKTLLRFIYTGELRLTLKNMFQIAYLGQKYMIGKVTQLVEFFFLEMAEDKKNFWSLFRPKEINYFDGNRNISLRKLTRRFCECPLSYFDTEEFLLSNEDTLAEILRIEEMSINELDLYKAVLRWATHQSKWDPSRMREKVDNFIHLLRLPTLSWSELTTGLSIADSELLLPEEKQYLLSYCGGLSNVPMPFVKMPRQNSLDVLFATARKSRNEMTTRRTSTYFVPLAAYRFLGVTCNIRNNDLEQSKCCFPRTVSFELVKVNRVSQKKEPIGSFKYTGWDGSVFCPAEEIYLLCPHTMYKLHTRPGPSTSMCTYTDSFTLGNGLKCLHNPIDQDTHAIKSFSLLPA